MAAYSKAQKLKSKRGRPKKEGVAREPNGRISRAKEDPAKVALEARMRKYGASANQARDPRMGTYIGRLAMAGREGGISMDQYEAAVRYLELYNNYRKSLISPAAHYDETAGGSSDPDAYDAWCGRVKTSYDKVQKAILDAQLEERSENLWAGLQYVIVENKELPHLVSSTRLVCNALHRHFMLDNKSKSQNK